MIKCTIELVPGGVESFRRTIGLMYLANASHLAEVSDYEVTVTEGSNPLTGVSAGRYSFKIHGHVRAQSVWKLVAAAIAGMEDADFVEYRE